jgi:hypothetical protein
LLKYRINVFLFFILCQMSLDFLLENMYKTCLRGSFSIKIRVPHMRQGYYNGDFLFLEQFKAPKIFIATNIYISTIKYKKPKANNYATLFWIFYLDSHLFLVINKLLEGEYTNIHGNLSYTFYFNSSTYLDIYKLNFNNKAKEWL